MVDILSTDSVRLVSSRYIKKKKEKKNTYGEDYKRMPACVFTGLVVSHSANSWTAAHQAYLSTEFSRQEYWSGVPFSPPRDFPDPGIEPVTPATAGRCFTTEPPGKPFLENDTNHLIFM